MSLRYVHKCLVACYLVLFLVINAVADISFDYYFGNDEPLRSRDNIKDCRTVAMVNHCHQICGPKHACLLGQCFCVQVNAPPEENFEEELVEEESSVENTGAESFEQDEDDEQETSSNYESNNIDEELADRPTLRHHIAHFCPNLNVARVCIRKCMKVGKPAFCGKDHKCYCGHQYEYPGKDPVLNASEVHNQFKDLYEKYFGPKINDIVKMHEATLRH